MNPRRELFLISFLILFFELAAIRWFASTVVFLTFFTNIVLLACFLGMSVGLLTAARQQNLIKAALPIAVLAFAAAVATNVLYWNWSEALTVTVGNQQTSARLVYFGTEFRPPDPGRWVIPMWAVAAAFFTLIALMFVGLGQVMGRAFAAIPDRVVAYSVDILGSLCGIGAFAAVSWLQLPPTVWFAPIVALILYFCGWRSATQLVAGAAAYVLVAMGAHALNVHGELFWSPYYKIAYDPFAQVITTNDISHQEMMPVSRRGAAYALPHLLNRDAGGARFDNVMIIGAGSGNDVAAALHHGAGHVDAVEIDPRIYDLGRRLHPEQPYSDRRVAPHLDDGRSFVRHTERKYDLVVYALVDSLVLHSGYSSLRLENFLFTREAFEDVKRTLAPDGVFAMYNFYRQGWVVGRLAQLAAEAFGTTPMVISLPYAESVAPLDHGTEAFTLILVGADSARVRAIRERFRKDESFWVNPTTALNEPRNGFARASPGADWQRVAPARVVVPPAQKLPEDDWPHLYLRYPEIPWAPIGQGMLAVAILSALLLLAFAPVRRARPNWPMFLLGAGFMLLETKGVVHMALLFGATWVVNLVVFAAILSMVLAANLYVLRFRPRRLAVYYGLLVVALLVNALVPMNVFLSLAPLWRTLASCVVVFVPVFFAGVIFASLFRESSAPNADFGWNVAGIILGGLSETLSLAIGFNYLLLIATAYYVLSFALRGKPAARGTL